MVLRTLADRLGREAKPEFSLARGAATDTAPPPYDFEGVTMRYFPLPANFHTLSMFVDDYLNIVPHEFAYFRPAAPFVLLCIVNYGKMAPGAGNLGWTAQNEVLFNVPLEWYVCQDGHYVFKDSAQVSPFIWVDNEGSQLGGREVFGWPKVQGWYGTGPGSWTRHPRSPLDLLGLNTRVFEELYEDEEAQVRELLVVREEPVPSFTEVPPDPEGQLNPMLSIPKALAGWSKLAMRGLETMMALPSRGYEPVDRQTNLVSAMASLDLFTERMHGNTVNLKQMRAAGSPRQVCYQALTVAQMQITQFRRGGMLGDWAQLRGDSSGGYRIRLHRYESLPIIETLGLEVDRELDVDGGQVAELKPLMPFWQELDMKYLTGSNICWRSVGRPWRDNDREEVQEGETRRDDLYMYNTTGSAGLQVATGPFRFTDATIRVLPLLADPAKLKEVCDKQLNNVGRDELVFEPWGSYVYLVITSYGKMYSETNDMGEWAEKQLDFAIPIRYYRYNGSSKELVGSGFFSPFIYSDSTIAATTGREVYGWNVQKASIFSPASPWLDQDGPFPEVSPLLKLKTDVYPALFVGQQNEWRSLVDIVDGNLLEDDDWQYVADGWGRDTKREVERLAQGAVDAGDALEGLEALSLELLANRAPIDQISFKQFRDAEHPDRACYQALVRRHWTIQRLFNLREIENQIHVKIHRYENQPIVQELGLRVQASWDTESGYVDTLQPLRPFYMKVHLLADDGANLTSRADSTTWETHVGHDARFLSGSPLAVCRELVEEVNKRPRGLRRRLHEWQDGGGESMDRIEAEGAIRSENVEPQSVVNRILSARWGRTDKTKTRQSRPLGPFRIRRDSVGDAADDLFGPSKDADDIYWSPGD